MKKEDGSQPNNRVRSAGVNAGRFFKMEFSPLENPRSLSSAGSNVARHRTQTSEAGDNNNAEMTASAYGSAADKKVHQLEDALNNFQMGTPPQSEVNHRSTAGDDEENPLLLNTQKRARVAGPTGGGTNSGGASGNAAGSLTKDSAARKQKLDAWLSVAEKGNNKLRVENTVLEKLALMAQENCLDNDAKYEEAISQLRMQLDYAQTFRQDSSAMVQNVDERMAGIRGLISELVTTAERTSQQEHEAVRLAFQKQLEQQKKELEGVRENGKNTTHDWKQKNMVLQDHLEKVMHETQSTYERLSALQAESRRLRVEFSAQAGDSEFLQNEYRRVYAEHQRLKDRLYTLETNLAKTTVRSELDTTTPQLKPTRPNSRSVVSLDEELRRATEEGRGLTSGGGGSPVANSGGSGRLGDDAKHADYQLALRKVQLLLETESANLKSVREAHLVTLRQRTELEVMLRQLIVRRKHEKLRSVGASQVDLESALSSSNAAAKIARKELAKAEQRGQDQEARVLCALDGAPVAFHAQDRKEIVNQLLANSRVLSLLFNEPAAALQQHPPDEGVGSRGHVSSWDRGSSRDGSGRAAGGLSTPMRQVESVANPTVHEERELTSLYETWREWTARANKEAFEGIARLS